MVIFIKFMDVEIAESRGTFFDEQHEPECRIAVKIIPMQAFAPEKSKPLIELYCSKVCDFSFQRDLFQTVTSVDRGIELCKWDKPPRHCAQSYDQLPFEQVSSRYLFLGALP